MTTHSLIKREPSLAGPAPAPDPASTPPADGVLSGAVTYAQTRLVVLAHHDEDTAWADEFGHRGGGGAAETVVEVYSDSDSPPPGARHVPQGKGKEARAYLQVRRSEWVGGGMGRDAWRIVYNLQLPLNDLQAILDHWDALPDAIAFLHAHNSSKHTVVGGRSPAKLGTWNSSHWRLSHLSWATDEFFVALSVGGGARAWVWHGGVGVDVAC